MSEAPNEVEDVAAADADNAPASAEDRAALAGWKPADQLKDPSKFVDAETFLKRREEIPEIGHENFQRLERDLAKAHKEIGKLHGTLANLSEHHSKTAQREYERAERTIQGRLDAAAHAGDVQGVRDATDELVELTKEVRADAPKGAGADLDPVEVEAFEDWQAENLWFGKDSVMTAATKVIANELSADGLKGRSLVKAVDKRVRDEFPHKFTNPRRNGAASVEGGGSPIRRTGKTYSDLPADAKAMADDFEKRGVMKKDAYAKEFFAQ